MMKRARTFRCCRTPGRFALAAALLLVISACATRAPAPIEDRSIPSPQAKRTAPASPPAVKPPPAHTAESDARPQTYTVKRGDTLHLIALDHGLDYRELAAWNGIQNVDVIRVGQVLRLGPPGDAVASTTTTTGSGVTTAPLKSAAPIVAGGAAPPPTANGGGTAGAPPGANPAQGAAAAPTLSPAPVPERAPAPVVTSRNSDTYKTQPKAAKEPYSERALREMQQRFQGSTAVASNASSLGGSAAPAGSSAAAPNSSSPEVAMPAASAPSPSGSPAPAPQVIARADTKLDSKPAAPGTADEDDDNKLDWTWPTAGKLVTGFSDTANLKGIDIAGKTGQPVLASAAGKVVYAGSGLRGYGKLIIIKHNKNYLSAYAHNKDILVKEGQQVTRGQKIAEMGNTDADQVKLHFEIRRLGKPMDPLKFLPPAS